MMKAFLICSMIVCVKIFWFPSFLVSLGDLTQRDKQTPKKYIETNKKKPLTPAYGDLKDKSNDRSNFCMLRKFVA